MFISKIELQNFKRFTDLTIDLSGENKPPKLVLLIGANGSGKSSVFDAFNLVGHNQIPKEDAAYFVKRNTTSSKIGVGFSDGKSWESDLPTAGLRAQGMELRERFYGRTSFRQLPRIDITSLESFEPGSFEANSDKSHFFIDHDGRFRNDLMFLTDEIVGLIFNRESTATSIEIQDRYVVPVNEALRRIFGDDQATALQFNAYYPPVGGGKLRLTFSKGDSVDFSYDLLSAGEKEIFNILLNLLHRNRYFDDTIYFIDELDLHLNTTLQKALLKEIVENWIPGNSQLWTATHSLGFIEYANEAEHAVIIDLDNLDFDQKQVLLPNEKQQYSIFEIAVPAESLAELLKNKKVVFAENTDTEFYNKLNIQDTVFVNAVDRNDVFTRATTTQNFGLADRDFLTDDEVSDIFQRYSRLRLLAYYSIENYFYHPDNVEELLTAMGKTFDRGSYINEIVSCKNNLLGDIAIGLHRARGSYFYFKEDDKRRSVFLKNEGAVLELLKSNDFEIFYKVFPMKGNCAALTYKNQLSKTKLARTNWFARAINERLKA